MFSVYMILLVRYCIVQVLKVFLSQKVPKIINWLLIGLNLNFKFFENSFTTLIRQVWIWPANKCALQPAFLFKLYKHCVCTAAMWRASDDKKCVTFLGKDKKRGNNVRIINKDENRKKLTKIEKTYYKN